MVVIYGTKRYRHLTSNSCRATVAVLGYNRSKRNEISTFHWLPIVVGSKAGNVFIRSEAEEDLYLELPQRSVSPLVHSPAGRPAGLFEAHSPLPKIPPYNMLPEGHGLVSDPMHALLPSIGKLGEESNFAANSLLAQDEILESPPPSSELYGESLLQKTVFSSNLL